MSSNNVFNIHDGSPYDQVGIDNRRCLNEMFKKLKRVADSGVDMSEMYVTIPAKEPGGRNFVARADNKPVESVFDHILTLAQEIMTSLSVGSEDADK